MLVAALSRDNGIPHNLRYLPVGGSAFEIAEADTVGREHGHVAVAEEEHISRMPENRRNVRRDEVLVVTQADHDRRPRARGDDFVWIRLRENRESEHAGQLLYGRAYRGFQVPR